MINLQDDSYCSQLVAVLKLSKLVSVSAPASLHNNSVLAHAQIVTCMRYMHMNVIIDIKIKQEK